MKIFDKIKRYISPSLSGGVGVGSFLLWKGVGVGIFVACCLAACTADDGIPSGQNEEGYDPTGQLIQFAVANEGTRAASYMVTGGRFAMKMYYHEHTGDSDNTDYDVREVGDATDPGLVQTSWFQVDDKGAGNSLYRKGDFTTPTAPNVDQYGDKQAVRFYWNNRKKHIFLAITDGRVLTTGTSTSIPGINMNNQDAWTTRNGKRCYYNRYYMFGTPSEIGANGFPINYSEYYTDFSKMPDPMMAYTEKTPEGSTAEANRVVLTFVHQFSHIQVNLKNAEDGSVNIPPDNITKVELLGVSEMAYVPNQIRRNTTDNPETNTYVDESYGEAVTVNNTYPNGTTAFSMPAATSPTDGFIKTFNAIAFGQLNALKITWVEDSSDPVEHVVTYKITDDNLKSLKSGKRYIYNLELRRYTLSVIRVELEDWEDGPHYSGEGTKDTTNP